MVMDLPQSTYTEQRPLLFRETERPTLSPRLWYLWPSRYFHFYMFRDRPTHQTCWLPEGYNR